MKYRVLVAVVTLVTMLVGCTLKTPVEKVPDQKTLPTPPLQENQTSSTSPIQETTTMPISLPSVQETYQLSTEFPINSHFGIHPGGLDYEKAEPFIKELGSIYVREELFEDSGWRHFKIDKQAESFDLCKKYCVSTEYTNCDCTDGIYYADMHPGINHISGISFYENNFNLLVTILNYTNSKTEPPNFESTYDLKKESVYQKYLDYLLTGMPDVRYWQIANEVDLAFWSGTPENYLEMVQVSYSEIKKKCFECKIGVSFNSSFDNLQVRWISVLKELGKQCDFVDAHLLPIDGMDMRKLNAMDLSGWQELCPNAELVSTETGLPDQKLHPDWGGLWGLGGTREKQAADLIKYCTILFDKGYSKIFWFISDFDFEPIEDDLFEHAGLITTEFERKPSFFAFKTLILKVDGFETVTKLNDGQYKYTFSGRSPVYVLWRQENSSLPADIIGIIKVTDYQGIEKIMNASDLILEDNPVFVENKE